MFTFKKGKRFSHIDPAGVEIPRKADCNFLLSDLIIVILFLALISTLLNSKQVLESPTRDIIAINIINKIA